MNIYGMTFYYTGLITLPCAAIYAIGLYLYASALKKANRLEESKEQYSQSFWSMVVVVAWTILTITFSSGSPQLPLKESLSVSTLAVTCIFGLIILAQLLRGVANWITDRLAKKL